MKEARGEYSVDEIRCYRNTEPNAQKEWDAAREDSADTLFDEALSVARDPFVSLEAEKPGEPHIIVRRDPSHARTYIDTLKWAARIRNPRLYGERAQLDLNVKTLDLTRIIEDANARLIAGRATPALAHAAHAAIEHQASKLLELL